MAGEVLLLNFCAVTNGSASIEHLCYKAATTPSPEPLCVSVKSQRSVKHIWFLPTHIAKAQKTKRACPYPQLKKNDITLKVYIFAPDAN